MEKHYKLLLAAVFFFAFIGSVSATPLDLIGGEVLMMFEPDDPISGPDLLLMTDGNNSTGFVFSSGPGGYSDGFPGVRGFSIRLDFDITDYADITAIDFSWTGIQSSPSSYNHLRIEDEQYWPGVQVFTPDGQMVSGSLSFTNGGGYGRELSNVIDGNIASIWLTTHLGSMSSATSPLILDTREVVADITGRYNPIPEPATMLLLGTGLICLAGMRRRLKN